jgi:hypothetical protein
MQAILAGVMSTQPGLGGTHPETIYQALGRALDLLGYQLVDDRPEERAEVGYADTYPTPPPMTKPEMNR